MGWDWPIGPDDRPLLVPKAKPDAVATDQHRAAWQRVFSRPIGGGPTSRGFDHYFGTDVPNWPPYCFIEDDRTIGIPSEFLPARLLRNNLASLQGPALRDWTLEPILPTLGDRAVRFILDSAAGSRPFFLYMPLTAPHTPLAVTEEWRGKSGLNTYADFVMETDAVVGRVLKAIDDAGTVGRTLVLFTSDNGCAPYIGAADLERRGHYPSGPLRGYKSDAWEGGHRVPFIVRWPGVVEPASLCERLVHQADVMATFADIVGQPLPDTAGEDSFSLLPLLHGKDPEVRETAVSQSMRGLLAVRRGPWKLIFGKGSGGWSPGEDVHPVQLYNLTNDLSEMHNLYADRPDIVTQLDELMKHLVHDGRSTPGSDQPNDVPVRWKPLR